MGAENREDLRTEIRWLMEAKYGGNRFAGGGKAQRDIARLKKGEHIDYVIGWVEFLGCKIDLSQKPFIPRPETEFWAQKVMHGLKPNGKLYMEFDSWQKKSIEQLMKKFGYRSWEICKDQHKNGATAWQAHKKIPPSSRGFSCLVFMGPIFFRQP